MAPAQQEPPATNWQSLLAVTMPERSTPPYDRLRSPSTDSASGNRHHQVDVSPQGVSLSTIQRDSSTDHGLRKQHSPSCGRNISEQIEQHAERQNLRPHTPFAVCRSTLACISSRYETPCSSRSPPGYRAEQSPMRVRCDACATTGAGPTRGRARIMPRVSEYVCTQCLLGGTHPPEQAMHIARTLQVKHPDWIFAGITAAAIHGFEHQWRLHEDAVTVITPQRGSNTDTPPHTANPYSASRDRNR